MPHTAQVTLTSTDDVPLSLYRHTRLIEPNDPESKQSERPCVVAVHGYPDNAGIWNALIPYLLEIADVVTYDVRGTGASGEPAERSGYALPQLVADLDTVVTWAAKQSNGPIHLLGHDWGSIQAWQAVTGVGSSSQVATFTSISGPCLDHVDRWIRQGLRRGSHHRGAVLRQLGHSAYIPFFKVRGLAELAGATGMLARVMNSATDTGRDVPGFSRRRRDVVNGLELYRQNMLTRRDFNEPGRGPGPRLTKVPVQIITPIHDSYVGPPLGSCARNVMPEVTIRTLAAAHWAIVSHPSEVANMVSEFAGLTTNPRRESP